MPDLMWFLDRPPCTVGQAISSSLFYLKQLPVDQIKIDKSFVLDMAANEDDAFIAQSIIDLGHHLGLEVLADRSFASVAFPPATDLSSW